MEAMLYDRLDDGLVRCHVCEYRCLIKPGQRGICGVRENQGSRLIALNFGISIATSIDPIEKKPIYDYMPHTMTYSFSTVGCNMDCPWCQNNSISQSPKPHQKIEGYKITPSEHVANAIRFHCPSISYTYSEPTIFLEYAYETMKIAKRNGLKNIWVSNGYMSDESLDMILPYLDAINIDYKGNRSIYKDILKCRADVVTRNLKRLKEAGVHVEVTTLIIPGINHTQDIIKEMVGDLINAMGTDFVWHISRFFPHYKYRDKPITPRETLLLAKQIGTEAGIHKIYLGNI